MKWLHVLAALVLLKRMSTLLNGIVLIASIAICPTAFGDPVTAFTSDFTTGAPPEFSGVVTTEDVQGYAGLGTGPNVFSGDFLRNASEGDPASPTTLTLDDLPPHTSINLNFLLGIIDSWDGESAAGSPDFFNVSVDEELVFSESFENILSDHVASYPSNTTPADVVLVQKEQLGFNTVNDFEFLESGYNMGLEPAFDNIPHTSSTLTIEWFASGAGWQGGDDESWAIDNVEIVLNDDAGTVGGSITGISVEKGTAICVNETTHQALRIPLADTTSWNCEDEGLIVNQGDKIRIVMHVRGTAN